MTRSLDYMYDEICANCRNSYGSHHAGISPNPRNYCPGNEGCMDWENNKKGTIFKGTGKFGKCQFYPREGCVCDAGSDVSGKFICDIAYSLNCPWAAELREEEK